MREEFQNPAGDVLIIDDQGITYKKGQGNHPATQGEFRLNNCYCPYGCLSSFDGFMGISAKFMIDGQICSFMFPYAPAQKADKVRYKEAVKFVKQAIKTAPPAKAVNLDSQIEHKMYCNTCKKIYCFTDEDIRKNSAYAEQARQQSNLELSSAFGGTRIQTQLHAQQSQNYRDKIVNYNKCPYCGSIDVREEV